MSLMETVSPAVQTQVHFSNQIALDAQLRQPFQFLQSIQAGNFVAVRTKLSQVPEALQFFFVSATPPPHNRITRTGQRVDVVMANIQILDIQ